MNQHLFYGKVEPPWWDDKPVAIIGGGRSLDGFDFKRLRGIAYVLAVKGVIFDIPWADAGTGIDAPRYIEWADRIGQVTYPIYWAASGMHDLKPWPHVTFLHRLETDGMTDKLDSLTGGGTSGYGAINLAVHKRARQIVLFGFDYRGTDGHHNEQHYIRKRNKSAGNWKMWADRFRQIPPIANKRGIEIINASPDSLIDAFPKLTVDEGVAWIAAQQRQEAT